MAESKDSKYDKTIKEIGELIGEAIVLTVSRDRPGSGQDELTDDEKVKVKKKVSEAFTLFLQHQKWKEKTDPVIHDFQRQYLPKLMAESLIKDKDENQPDHGQKVLGEAFPSLDAEFESHAVLNLIAHVYAAGPFRKIKDETLAKIVEETWTMIGLSIAYLRWRVETTTPSKEEQH